MPAFRQPPSRRPSAALPWAEPLPERRPRLTREAVVEAAMQLADAEGLGAVSIRRVAAQLGARTMSLYTYIARKEDLLDLMADEVAGEVLIEGSLPADWRKAITLIARREREVARRHPWMVELLGRQPRFGPNALRHAEQTAAALSGLRLSALAAWQVATAVDHLVLGQVVFDATQLHGTAAVERSERLVQYFRELSRTGDFPHLAPLLADGVPTEDSFEQGLGWLLDGIALQHGGGQEQDGGHD
jgi:AcrR family transcriptional regulator